MLLEMLDDPPTIVAVAAARAEYARRRHLVAGVLERIAGQLAAAAGGSHAQRGRR